MIIIKEIKGRNAWWYKTPADAYKDLQNCYGFDTSDLPTRDEFINEVSKGFGIKIDTIEAFQAVEGDQ